MDSPCPDVTRAYLKGDARKAASEGCVSLPLIEAIGGTTPFVRSHVPGELN